MSTIEKAMGKLGDTTKKPAISPSSKQTLASIEEVSPTAPLNSTDVNELGQSSIEKELATNTSPIQKEVVGQKVVKKTELYIDNDRLRNMGMICNGNGLKERVVKDEFRAIKRKLINNAFGPSSSYINNGNLIMVSSSKMNEGKTFISINLALSIASEQDKTVLLVDADVLKPSVGEILDLEERPGLIDYLLGETDDVSEIIYPTNIPDLRIMPAGVAHHMSYELLSSDRMLALAGELASRYPDRIVVFDCPPLLGVVETVTLSSLIGQAIVVVEENKSKLADVKEAVSLLNSDMAIGFVINKSVNKKDYGYGYGYGYGAKRQTV